MQFNSIFLTNAGVALINRAVSGTTVIWGECACTSDTLTASSTAIANRVCSGNTVAAFNDEEETVALSCSMDNTAAGLSAGNAVSFGIYAKIQGDENYVLVLYATSNNPMAITAYSSDDDTTKVRVLVNLSLDISNGVVQSIAVTEPNVYALAQDLQTEINARQAADAGLCTKTELNELASRVVTTNVQGDSSTGENQNIRGEKAFLSRLYANLGFTSNAISYVYGALNVAYNNQQYMLSLQYVGGSSSTVASQGFSRICTKDSGQNDGTSILRLGTWGSGGTYNYMLELVRETRWPQQFTHGYYWDFTAAAMFREGIYLGGHIMPDAANTTQGYADVDVGAKTMPMRKVYTKALYCDEIVPLSSGSTGQTIGTSTAQFDEVYAKRLHGVINYPVRSSSNTILVQVGGIICVYGITKSAGETFTVSPNSTKEGRLDGTAGDKYISEGTYVALSTAGNGGSVGTILAMCISQN